MSAGTATAPPALRTARRIAHLTDGLLTLPGTRIRVGLDPLLGLVPGVGDLLAWGVSLHLVWAGWRLGATPSTLVRMSAHIVLDAALGMVPVAGDLFDVVWRANERNLRVLEALHADPRATRRASRLWLVGVVAGSTAVVGGVVWALLRVAATVWSVLAGG